MAAISHPKDAKAPIHRSNTKATAIALAKRILGPPTLEAGPGIPVVSAPGADDTTILPTEDELHQAQQSGVPVAVGPGKGQPARKVKSASQAAEAEAKQVARDADRKYQADIVRGAKRAAFTPSKGIALHQLAHEYELWDTQHGQYENRHKDQ